MNNNDYSVDVAIIGGGIAGIVTALELLDSGKRLAIIDRDTPERFGGLARWAFGGMALVGTPEQQRMGVVDTPDIALRDWQAFAEFGEQDHWPKAWAERYVAECRSEVYDWLIQQGLKFLPAVNWVERGLYTPGNSLPRYHILWGTGWELVEVLSAKLKAHSNAENLIILHQHRVTELLTTEQGVNGCRGIDESSATPFDVRAGIVVAATGGINGTTQRVKDNWHKPWGAPPAVILNGAHPYADGHVHDEVERLGGRLSHLDAMWNYAAGIPHPQPHFDGHGLSLIPCKSALWLDHQGRRIGPDPLVTGFDTHYLCKRVSEQKRDYTWQVLNWKIAAKELAVSGSEHNQSIRDKRFFRFLKEILLGNHALVKQLAAESENFLVADDLPELVNKMNSLVGDNSIDPVVLQQQISAYDEQLSLPRKLWNDDQIRRIEHARQWRSDRMRTCKPTAIVDPKAGPLIAIRLRLISRKSLGGIQTDLQSRVLCQQGEPINGLYAVGEAAGFGGGNLSGKRSLEGTFLSACIYTARKAASSIAAL